MVLPILELKSVSESVYPGPEDVRMFSGAGIVSVWNRGLDLDVVGLILVGSAVGSIVLVKVLEINRQNLKVIVNKRNLAEPSFDLWTSGFRDPSACFHCTTLLLMK